MPGTAPQPATSTGLITQIPIWPTEVIQKNPLLLPTIKHAGPGRLIPYIPLLFAPFPGEPPPISQNGDLTVCLFIAQTTVHIPVQSLIGENNCRRLTASANKRGRICVRALFCLKPAAPIAPAPSSISGCPPPRRAAAGPPPESGRPPGASTSSPARPASGLC